MFKEGSERKLFRKQTWLKCHIEKNESFETPETLSGKETVGYLFIYQYRRKKLICRLYAIDLIQFKIEFRV